MFTMTLGLQLLLFKFPTYLNMTVGLQLLFKFQT